MSWKWYKIRLERRLRKIYDDEKIIQAELEKACAHRKTIKDANEARQIQYLLALEEQRNTTLGIKEVNGKKLNKYEIRKEIRNSNWKNCKTRRKIRKEQERKAA